MKLDVKAMAIAFGIWWGVLGIFLVGLINLIWPPLWPGMVGNDGLDLSRLLRHC